MSFITKSMEHLLGHRPKSPSKVLHATSGTSPIAPTIAYQDQQHWADHHLGPSSHALLSSSSDCTSLADGFVANGHRASLERNSHRGSQEDAQEPLQLQHQDHHLRLAGRPTSYPAPVIDLKVHNQSGYLARVELSVEFPGVDPRAIWDVLVHPDNSGVFRDIKRVKDRIMLEAPAPGIRAMRVSQVGEALLLWRRREFLTELRVEEDARDPGRLKQRFELLHSDMLSRFHGEWVLERMPPMRRSTPQHSATKHSHADPHAKQNVEEQHASVVQDALAQWGGTRVALTQDILPKRVPMFVTHMPVVGPMIRATITRAVTRVVDDMCELVKEMQVSGMQADAVIHSIRQRRAAGAAARNGADSEEP